MFHYGSKLGAKRAEVMQLMQKFVPRSHIGIFRNKRARSTHWILNSCFRVFLSVWVHLGLCGCCIKLGAKWAECGAIIAKVRATKSHRNFSQRTYRVHPIRPQTDVLVCFILFGCILDSLVALRNSVQNGPNKCKSSCHEVVSEFFTMNAPDTPHWTLNLCFSVFRTIWVHLGPLVALRYSGKNRPN